MPAVTPTAFSWLPILLGLASAFLYGVSAVCSRRGIAHLEPQLAAIVSLGATALTFLLTSPLWMRTEDWFSPGFWTIKLEFEGIVVMKGDMLASAEQTVRGYARVESMAATDGQWQEAMQQGSADLVAKMKTALRDP